MPASSSLARPPPSLDWSSRQRQDTPGGLPFQTGRSPMVSSAAWDSAELTDDSATAGGGFRVQAVRGVEAAPAKRRF